MSEKEAVTKCESDSRCGGFTFKGIPSPGSEFEIFFFHAITDISDGGEYLEWTYYLGRGSNKKKKKSREFSLSPRPPPPPPVK